jgi:hypothetical protein
VSGGSIIKYYFFKINIFFKKYPYNIIMDTDESVLPLPNLDKIGWGWGLFYIILSIVLIFVIPSLLVLKDIKSKGISTKEISIDNLYDSLKTTIIRGNIINQIKHFTDAGAVDHSDPPDPSDPSDTISGDPILINPDEIPPKTCSDIHGTPEDPTPFTCVSTGGGNIGLISEPENTTCLPKSGCTELDCCVNRSDSCKLGIFAPGWGLQDTTITAHCSSENPNSCTFITENSTTSGPPGTYDRTISNNIIEYLDLSEILPQDIPQVEWSEHSIDIETPFIVNCSEGHVNTEEYTTEFENIYSGSSRVTDYERQAVITCGDEGYLKFGRIPPILPCSIGIPTAQELVGDSDYCELSTITQPTNGQWGDICHADVGEGDTISQGETCDFNCDAGYTLTDQPTCNNGILSSNTATCTPFPRTCGDTDGNGTNNLFVCNNPDNVLSNNPTGITCDTDPCTETECCNLPTTYILGDVGQSCTEACGDLTCEEDPPEFRDPRTSPSIFDSDGPFGDLNCHYDYGSTVLLVTGQPDTEAAPYIDLQWFDQDTACFGDRTPNRYFPPPNTNSCDAVPGSQPHPMRKRLCKCYGPG